MSKTIKVVFGLIPIVIAVISLLVSYCSYQVAKDSNKIATEALRVSKQNFALEKRPYISLSPKKFKEEDKFILASEKENGIELRVQFEMKNTGQLPAKDIRIPKTLIISTKKNVLPDWPPPNISYQEPLGIDLAAGESSYIQMNLFGVVVKKNWSEFLKRIENNKFPLSLEMVVLYKSDLDPSLEYQTTAFVTIRTNEATISDREIK